MDGLRCIDDFTLRCLDREHRAYFNTLYAGTTQVIVDLCQEGPYQSGMSAHCYISIPKYEIHTSCTLDILFIFQATWGRWAKGATFII